MERDEKFNCVPSGDDLKSLLHHPAWSLPWCRRPPARGGTRRAGLVLGRAALAGQHSEHPAAAGLCGCRPADRYVGQPRHWAGLSWGDGGTLAPFLAHREPGLGTCQMQARSWSASQRHTSACLHRAGSLVYCQARTKLGTTSQTTDPAVRRNSVCCH